MLIGLGCHQFALVSDGNLCGLRARFQKGVGGDLFSPRHSSPLLPLFSFFLPVHSSFFLSPSLFSRFHFQPHLSFSLSPFFPTSSSYFSFLFSFHHLATTSSPLLFSPSFPFLTLLSFFLPPSFTSSFSPSSSFISSFYRSPPLHPNPPFLILDISYLHITIFFSFAPLQHSFFFWEVEMTAASSPVLHFYSSVLFHF